MSENIINTSNEISYASSIPALDLAYLGDAVMELLAREYLIRSGVSGPLKLNKKALEFVKATAQSAAVDNIISELSETELGVYKHARNGHSASAPKSASIREYRRATGIEALFAWLWISGQKERANELFIKAYKLCDDKM